AGDRHHRAPRGRRRSAVAGAELPGSQPCPARRSPAGADRGTDSSAIDPPLAKMGPCSIVPGRLTPPPIYNRKSSSGKGGRSKSRRGRSPASWQDAKAATEPSLDRETK